MSALEFMLRLGARLNAVQVYTPLMSYGCNIPVTSCPIKFKTRYER